MSTPTFYHPELLESDASVEMSAEESAHAVKSRRLRVGQEIRLFNGCGLVARAEMSLINRNSVLVKIIDSRQLNRNRPKVSVATAIPKGDRQRFMIEALCQLGVDHITPLNCEHSVTRFSEKMAYKWQRFAVEACKQSQNAWLPIIEEEQHLEHWLEQKKCSGDRLIYADALGESPETLVITRGASEQNCICIGPEGGFSTAEIELLVAAAGTPIKLSDNILRTETAAIAGLLLLRR